MGMHETGFERKAFKSVGALATTLNQTISIV